MITTKIQQTTDYGLATFVAEQHRTDDLKFVASEIPVSVSANLSPMNPDGDLYLLCSRGNVPIPPNLYSLIAFHKSVAAFDFIKIVVIPHRCITKLIPSGAFTITASSNTASALIFNPTGYEAVEIAANETITMETKLPWSVINGANGMETQLMITGKLWQQ